MIILILTYVGVAFLVWMSAAKRLYLSNDIEFGGEIGFSLFVAFWLGLVWPIYFMARLATRYFKAYILKGEVDE